MLSRNVGRIQFHLLTEARLTEITCTGERDMAIDSSCIRHGGGAGRSLGMALITQ